MLTTVCPVFVRGGGESQGELPAPVGGAWVVRGRCVRGAWVVHGRRMGGALEVRERCVGGAWEARGRCVGGAWEVRGRCMGGAWVVRGCWLKLPPPMVHGRCVGEPN